MKTKPIEWLLAIFIVVAVGGLSACTTVPCPLELPPPVIGDAVSRLDRWSHGHAPCRLQVCRDPDFMTQMVESREGLEKESTLRLEVRNVGAQIVDTAGLAELLSHARLANRTYDGPLRWGIVLYPESYYKMDVNDEVRLLLMPYAHTGSDQVWAVLNGERIDLPVKATRRWIKKNLSWRIPEFGNAL